MLKKILFAALVLFGLGLAGMAEDCFADTAELYAAARKYEKSMQYEQARNLYQKVIADEPDTEWALKAQKRLAYILIEQNAEAQPEIDKLIENFAGHPGLPKALWNIAQRYEYSRRYYQQAGDVYNLVIEIAPDSPYADTAKLDIAKVNILALVDAAKEAEAAAAIDKLVADFTGHSYLPAALHGIARRYEELSRYEKALSVYQRIIDGWPDSSYAGKAKLDVAKEDVLLLIESGRDDTVWIAFEKLIADFNGHPGLPQAVYRIGKGYYNEAFRYENDGLDEQARDHFAKAIGVWQRGIQALPGSAADAEYTALTYGFLGYCYNRLGDYEKAVEHYQTVVDNWPNYKYAWHALFMVGRNFEGLKKSGLMSELEADTMTKAAYEQLLKKYPGCEAAEYARYWISHYNFK